MTPKATPEEFERTLAAEGYEVLVRDLEPDKALPEHRHPWDVKAMILQGAFTVGTAEGERTYETGQVFELPADMPHTESHGPAGARLLLGRRHRR
jgi:quercetin dioxygenase-like cupin family protein